METKSILDTARNLIKAIDENTIEMPDNAREENDLFIPQRFIADELETLREWVNDGILERRE